jgi:hypothetical protein
MFTDDPIMVGQVKGPLYVFLKRPKLNVEEILKL